MLHHSSHLLAATATAPAPPLAVLTGGKSGGHVFPALALAQELASRGFRLAFVGNPESMESRLAARHGIDFHPIPAAAFVGQGLLARLRGAVVLQRSLRRAWMLLRRLRPAIVVATGGFVSVPTVLAAVARRLPVVLLEPNARAGAANRLLSRWARWAATAYEETAADLRCESTVTGVPVRREFFALPEVGQASGRTTVLVLGGSQGARSLNQALPLIVAERLVDRRIALLHQTGRGRLEETERGYRAALGDRLASASTTAVGRELEIAAGPVVTLCEFLDDVAAALAAAHLVVSRAGAVTLGEICAAGRASVLLPLPLAGAHQEHNAAMLVARGAARSVPGNRPSAYTSFRAAAASGLPAASGNSCHCSGGATASPASPPGSCLTVSSRCSSRSSSDSSVLR